MEGARGFAGGAGPERGPGGAEAEGDIGAREIGQGTEGVHAPAGENLGEGRRRRSGGEGQWVEKRAGVGDDDDGVAGFARKGMESEGARAAWCAA